MELSKKIDVKMIPIIEPQVHLGKNFSLERADALAARVGLEGFLLTEKKFGKPFLKQTSNCSMAVYSRVTIAGSKVATVRRLLAKVRKSFDVVAVQTAEAKVAHWVAKDNRVDILSMPSSSMKELLTKQLTNVAAQIPLFFEIDLKPFLEEKAPPEVNSIYLRQISRALNILLRERAPFIFTLNVGEPFAFKDARSIISFAKVLGIPYLSLKENYLKFKERLERNRKRLTEGFVAPGIWKVPAEEKKYLPKKQKETVENTFVLLEELKPQSLNEKRLERQRYLLFEIISEKEFELSEKELMNIFWSKFQKLFGEINSSRAGIYLSYYSAEKRVGILRTTHKMVDPVRATLLTIGALKTEKVIVNVLKISGTISNLLATAKQKSTSN